MERIAAADELTAGERVVAGFFEDAYPAVALLKLTEVCAATGVSTATVTRFARKLGYADFRALSRDLQDEVRARLDAPGDRLARLVSDRAPRRAAGDAGEAVAHAAPHPRPLSERYALTAVDLRESARSLDQDAFAHVVDLVADDSRPIYLGAVASGQPLLSYFALLLNYLRGGVTELEGTDRWAHGLAGLPEDAVVLCAAFDRYPVAVQRLLRFARGRGATTVLITNRRTSPLVADADHCLFVSSHADPMFRSRVGLLFALEALLDAVGRRHPDRTARASDIEQFFAVTGSYLPQGDRGTRG